MAQRRLTQCQALETLFGRLMQTLDLQGLQVWGSCAEQQTAHASEILHLCHLV